MFQVMYRRNRSAQWDACHLVDGNREKALRSAKQIAEQERCLGWNGQVGIRKYGARKVTIVRAQREEESRG